MDDPADSQGVSKEELEIEVDEFFPDAGLSPRALEIASRHPDFKEYDHPDRRAEIAFLARGVDIALEAVEGRGKRTFDKPSTVRRRMRWTQAVAEQVLWDGLCEQSGDARDLMFQQGFAVNMQSASIQIGYRTATFVAETDWQATFERWNRVHPREPLKSIGALRKAYQRFVTYKSLLALRDAWWIALEKYLENKFLVRDLPVEAWEDELEKGRKVALEFGETGCVSEKSREALLSYLYRTARVGGSIMLSLSDVSSSLKLIGVPYSPRP